MAEKMTLDQFLELLPIVADRKWTIQQNSYIRDENGRCPICSLVNEIDPSIHYYGMAMSALFEANITFDMASIVMGAADRENRSVVRKKMIEILNISKPVTP